MKIKILQLTLILFCISILRTSGQTASSFINSTKGSIETDAEQEADADEKDLDKGLSAGNFWIGAQLGYKLSGSGDFSDNLLVSGRLLYTIDLETDKFHLPVMGNISTLRNAISDGSPSDSIKAKTQDLLISAQGVNVGLYPYYDLFSNEVAKIVIHGSASWKINSFKNKIGENEYLDQGRFTMGLEASIGKSSTGNYPLTVSVAPSLIVFNPNKYNSIFGEKKKSLFSLEITGILPIGNGVGILFEGNISEKSKSAFRAGFVFAATKKTAE